MASLQLRGESWSCVFRFRGPRYWLTLGEIPEIDALAAKARVEYLLRLIKQNLLSLPPGCDIVTFMKNDGKAPTAPAPQKETVTFARFRDAYLKTHSSGTLEKTTLDGIRQHFKQWSKTLGDGFPMQGLGMADLQGHVDRRAVMKTGRGTISAATIKKEVVTLRTAWNWAEHFGLVTGRFPLKGLRYPKSDEKPPFMTWEEIERRVAAGADDELWDALYLRTHEIAELLAHVKANAAHPWIYPLFCFAAHTGARRSEIMRAEVADLDFAGEVVTLREKKRKRGTLTTRRVPMSKFLKEVLTEWVAAHPGGPLLFCQSGHVARSRTRSQTTGHESEATRAKTVQGRAAKVRSREKPPTSPLTRNVFHDHFHRVLAGSKWHVLRGGHTLRHSFVSALANAGVDQRVIDEMSGHTTEEMRRRYRHLLPSTRQDAIHRVFG